MGGVSHRIQQKTYMDGQSMKKAISLQHLVILLQSEKLFCEKELKSFTQTNYEKLAFLIKIHFGIPLEQAFKMLFYPNYTLNIELCFNVYKEKQDRYLTKKPSFFKRLFKRFSVHKITINNQKVILDNDIINKELAKKIWLVF